MRLGDLKRESIRAPIHHPGNQRRSYPAIDIASAIRARDITVIIVRQALPAVGRRIGPKLLVTPHNRTD